MKAIAAIDVIARLRAFVDADPDLCWQGARYQLVPTSTGHHIVVVDVSLDFDEWRETTAVEEMRHAIADDRRFYEDHESHGREEKEG